MMDKKTLISLLSFLVFFWIGLYIVIKFFIIVFWTMTFAPDFIKYMTPLFILNANSLQLFLISATVAGASAYLHFTGSRRNILLSYIPTLTILIGLSLAIYIYEWYNLWYYALFSIFVFAALMDYNLLIQEEEEEYDEEPLFEDEELLPFEDEEMFEEEENEESTMEHFIEEVLEAAFSQNIGRTKEGEELEGEGVEIEELPDMSARKKKGAVKVSKEEIEGMIDDLDFLLEVKEEDTEEGVKYCPICGTKNPKNARYCNNCGFEMYT